MFDTGVVAYSRVVPSTSTMPGLGKSGCATQVETCRALLRPLEAWAPGSCPSLLLGEALRGSCQVVAPRRCSVQMQASRITTPFALSRD